MKIDCLKEKLLGALIKADRVTSKNPSLAILSSVLLGASGNEMVIKATNLELGLEITIPAKVEEEGTIAINPGALMAFLGSISHEKNVSLKGGNNGFLAISSGSHTATIKTNPPEEFPHIPQAAEKEINISIDDFLEGTKSVWYSASVSSIKPELSSVYVYSNKEMLVFAATDSFRLAEKKIKLKKSIEDIHVLIPYKNIPEIIKTLDNEPGDVKITVDKNQISFTSSNSYLTSRVVDGTFPDYQKIIPHEHETEVTLLKSEVSEALRMVKIFSDKFNQISITVSSSKNSCEFTSKNGDVGEGNYVLKAKVKGDSVSLNFNHKYLTDSIQAIPTESLVLRFNGAGKALVISGQNDDSFTYLVMPNR